MAFREAEQFFQQQRLGIHVFMCATLSEVISVSSPF